MNIDSITAPMGSWLPPAPHALHAPDAHSESLAAIVVGIDRLRDVADALGSHAAEAVLATSAARLEARRRSSMMIAPLFGDAFGILVPGADREQAIEIARELHAVASQPIAIAEHELAAVVSVGVAYGSTVGVSAQSALRNAATAQHRAQELGGGRIELYESGAGESALEALRLQSELRGALRDEQCGLALFFQPIIALDTGAVTAVEALIRWIHPTLGLLLPQRFLPVAERSGLLGPIERWVIGEACTQLARLPEPRQVCINLSASALSDARLAGYVAEQLRHNGLQPDQLAVEISEGELLPARSAARLEELRALGVKVLLDDVGSGYSWLTRSQRLSVDGVKLSSTIVSQLEIAEVAGLARLIVETATKLELPVIAEGVEGSEQLERVRALGIGAAQGLHFLAPVPAATLADVLSMSHPGGRSHAGSPTEPRSVAPAGGEERALSLGQAAKLLGISASTLRRWAEDGRVSSMRTSGGHRRFHLSELSRLTPAGEAHLRTPALPDDPLPAVAELLASEGLEIATAAARSLYDDRPGWFARAAAQDPLRAFTDALAQAFDHGTYDGLGNSLRSLMLAATVGSATLAERHLFLERLAAAIDARLVRASRPAREQSAARRTLRALALAQLADCDAPSSAPRVPRRRRRANRVRETSRPHAGR